MKPYYEKGGQTIYLGGCLQIPDYDLITTPESGVVTFGTNVFVRKDRQALIIVFPAGQELHFAPEQEIEIAAFKGKKVWK